MTTYFFLLLGAIAILFLVALDMANVWTVAASFALATVAVVQLVREVRNA